MKPTETDYAWAAGIIDGEGCIAMTRAKVGVNRRKTESFQVRISVRMTHGDTIRRLHELFGGTFKRARSRDPLRHKSTFEWFVGDLATETTLRLVTPFLITKRSQAELVLKYRAECCPPINGGICAPVLVQRRRRDFDRLPSLNNKGPTPWGGMLA